MAMETRNYGLDIFRILCCIGVLDYHIMGAVQNRSGGGEMVYFLASFCVPGFFLLSGYLLSGRRDLSMNYIEEKVKGIMSKLFGWIIFWTVVHFVRTGEVYELWGNLTAGAFSGGILPVSWFLFTYCLLMVLAYPMFYLQKKHGRAFAIVSFVWIAALALGFGNEALETKTQALWLHLYVGYFALGMTLNHGMESISGFIKRKHQRWLALFVNIMCLAVYLYHIKAAQVLVPPHNYYGKWYYTLWLVSLFWIIALVRVENIMLRRLVERLSANTLVVYLAPHLPILYIIGKMPLQDTKMGLLFIVLFFLGSELLAEVFRRMPLLRELV